MAGMGHVPYANYLYGVLESGSKSTFGKDTDKLYQDFKNRAKMIEGFVLKLPTSYEFLKENIYS
jgi:hypothetical protein